MQKNCQVSSVNAVKKRIKRVLKSQRDSSQNVETCKNTLHDDINAPKYEIMIENAMQTQIRQWHRQRNSHWHSHWRGIDGMNS